MVRALAVAVGLATISIVPARAAIPPTMAPGELRPGQKAEIRTVFEGTRIETFEAEIVGVLKGGRAEGDLILGRATTERVQKSGIAQGMSGSPVYVDGKLVGALSGGWSFTREPIFSITPIGEMLDVLDVRESPGGASSGDPGAPRGPMQDLAFGPFRWNDDPADAGPAAPTGADPRRPRALPLPVACAGLDAVALDQARAWLAPFGLHAVPGGVSDAAPAPLEPGAAAAVELMRGDLELAAIGTVTWSDGERVLLFGHPFFQSGEVQMPLASAEIVTIVASDEISFKLGSRAAPAGVVTQDRRAAVAGRLSGSAPMMPIAITVEGIRSRPQRFRFESIEDRTLAPTLVSIAALNSVLESGGVGGRQTLRWTLRLHRRGAPPLAISGTEAGDSPAAEMAQGVVAPLAFLWSNPFERLALDSLDLVVQATPGRARWTLQSARVLDPVVRPGGTVRVRAELEQWQGPRETRDVALRIPEEIPDGRFAIFLGGSRELQSYEARSLPGRYRPTSLDDAWRRFAGLRPDEGLYAAVVGRAPEVTSDGRDYPELPLSALSLLAPSQAAGASARRGSLATIDERRAEVPGVVQGQLMLSVVVDRSAP